MIHKRERARGSLSFCTGGYVCANAVRYICVCGGGVIVTAVWIILRERNNFNYTTPDKQMATRIANNDVNTHVNLDAE
jgi:hypothetical protein